MVGNRGRELQMGETAANAQTLHQAYSDLVLGFKASRKPKKPPACGTGSCERLNWACRWLLIRTGFCWRQAVPKGCRCPCIAQLSI